MKNFTKDQQFIYYKDGNFEIYFSIGEKNYNKKLECGRKNIESLAEEFNLKFIKYLTQIHSDKVIQVTDMNEDVRNEEADGMISSLNNIGLGVFYADCVPVIIYDKIKGVIAAVHSGWKGTYGEIVKNAVNVIINNYDSKASDIKVIIGPHIRQCCYEISEELKEKFNSKESFSEVELFEGRNLSLEKAIIKSLIDKNIEYENIECVDICTCCEKNIKLHSYRRDGLEAGRCYAFVVKR